MVRLGVLYTLNHGSSPWEQTMKRELTETIINQAQSLYDEVGNIKKRLIEYKGGECQICGYNKCQDALEFHHLDPSKKDYNISGGTKSFNTLKSEVDKCILVCANCHREIHSGITKL